MRQNSISSIFEDSLASAKKIALQYLSRRDHSTHELSEKLCKKGYSKSTVSKTIDALKNIHLLDDARFIETWSRFRMDHHHFGPLRLRQELLKKGLPSDDVATHIHNISQTCNLEDRAEKTLLKRYGNPGQLKEKSARRRAFEFLRRKGHETEIIYKVFRKHNLMG